MLIRYRDGQGNLTIQPRYHAYLCENCGWDYGVHLGKRCPDKDDAWSYTSTNRSRWKNSRKSVKFSLVKGEEESYGKRSN